MDPWTKCLSNVSVSENNKIITKFEDDFVPELYEKLPDHLEYLAVLESKLLKLKSDPNILRQLVAKKESYMQQLLSEEPEYNLTQLSLEEPISNSSFWRTILPQKQALSQAEIVEFIKYDQLINDEVGDHQTVSKKNGEEVENNIEHPKP